MPLETADYLTQTASALGLCALDMGRIVTDLLLWATQEMNMIHVADGYISISSIMPQKRNPIALEHLRVLSVCSEGNGGYGTDRVSEKPVRGYF